MEYEEIVWELKEQRLGYGITQKELAAKVGISNVYLNYIESGRKRASNELLEKIASALRYLSPEPPLDILFDYVRIRFPTTDVRAVVRDILHLDIDYMYLEEHALYTYAAQYVLGDITVMFSPDTSKGVLLELKGKGCRQFETYLLAQRRSWYDFLFEARKTGGKPRRIDLAINDKVGMLNIPELTRKCRERECISVFRSFKGYQSGELSSVREDDKAEMGNTLYIGSMKSEIYFCVYEKDYEQYVKNEVPTIMAEVKNRFEIRLKNERAEFAVDDLMQHGDAGKTAFGIINRYIRFLDKEDGKKRESWKINADWLAFIGMEGRKLKLTSIPEPYTLDKSRKWMVHQVARSLKMHLTLDEIQGTNFVGTMLGQTKLGERQTALIEQELADVYEKII